METKNINNNGINAKDAEKISDIYNHGITFWHTTDVGNYSLNNGIVSG